MNVNTVFDNLTNNYLRFVLAEQRYFVIRDEATNHQKKKKKKKLTTKLHIMLSSLNMDIFWLILHTQKKFFS